MPRKGRRRTVDTNIYPDGSGVSVRVSPFPEVRYPLGTPLVLLQQARDALKKRRDKIKTTGRATLTRDAAVYMKRKRFANRYAVQAELDAWTDLYGGRSRFTLTKDDVLNARHLWLDQDYAPKTVNHRVNRLRALFRELDGRNAVTPCDDVMPLPVGRTPIQRIKPEWVLTVIANMRAKRAPYGKRLEKTIARFMVYASTGRRPSEIGRIMETDVDLEQRVWTPRDGKGGWSPGLYLNDDMLVAFEAMRDAKAWGRFSVSRFSRTLRSYGWPEGVRIYNLRHNVGIALSEAGHDLADVSAQMGHARIQTTRNAYVPVRNSRMQQMSESLNGRFGGFGVPQNRSTNTPEQGSDTPRNGPQDALPDRAKKAK